MKPTKKWTHLASERLHPVKGYFLNLKLLRSNLGPPSSRSWEKLQISAFREQIKRYVKGSTGQLYSRVVKIRAFSNLLEMRHCICACHMVHVFVPSSLWRTSKAGTEQIKRIESQTKRILGDPGAVSRVERIGATKVFARTWKLSSRLFSRPDWLPLGLRGWTKRNQMNGLSRNNFRIIPLLPFLWNERKLIWDLYHSTVKFRK